MVNTNQNKKFFISSTPQNEDLTASEFAALDWIQVSAVGSLGETGSNTNILSYDTWDTDVTQKGKGITDAGSPELEVARIPDDEGQIALRNASLTNMNYAFKTEGNDKKTLSGTPTIRYNRGIVTGPRTPNGRNEDFDLEMYALGFNQREVVVAPT